MRKTLHQKFGKKGKDEARAKKEAEALVSEKKAKAKKKTVAPTTTLKDDVAKIDVNPDPSNTRSQKPIKSRCSAAVVERARKVYKHTTNVREALSQGGLWRSQQGEYFNSGRHKNVVDVKGLGVDTDSVIVAFQNKTHSIRVTNVTKDALTISLSVNQEITPSQIKALKAVVIAGGNVRTINIEIENDFGDLFFDTAIKVNDIEGILNRAKAAFTEKSKEQTPKKPTKKKAPDQISLVQKSGEG